VRFDVDRAVILASPIASALFKCTIAAVTLEHKEANGSVMRLLVELLTLPKRQVRHAKQ